MMTNNIKSDTIDITFTHHGTPHTFPFPSSATISDLSSAISESLSIPPENQKLMIAKLGLLKAPFKEPSLPLTNLVTKKITLLGATAAEVSTISANNEAASKRALRPAPKATVQAYKTHDWKREQDESLYTFTTLRPLPYLPNPSRSLQFLQRLKDDAGIKATMRKHKFTVPLLTEMNPVEHTQSNHEGTSRTLGLNRNAGEVIELRLRTDAYDGYRDYKTIRKTLCHELAHNVHGPHDSKFWELCRRIEKEVEGADWKSGGHALGDAEEFYDGGDDVDDHGGWNGGEFVLGAGPGAGEGAAMGRREVLARAAEERMKKMKEEQESADRN